MRILLRVFGLGCIFVFVAMIFMQMMALNVRQDELNNAISSAMTTTQTAMKENIEDDLYQTDTARKKINSELDYKNEYVKNFAKLVGAETVSAAVGDQTSSKVYNSNIGELPTLEKDGYEFLGWFTQEVGGTQVTSTTKMPADDFNIYAHWKLLEYNLTYDLQGGTVSGTNPTKYNVETETFTLKNPTKAGKTFAGWTWEGHTKPQKQVIIATGETGDYHFVANWK